MKPKLLLTKQELIHQLTHIDGYTLEDATKVTEFLFDDLKVLDLDLATSRCREIYELIDSWEFTSISQLTEEAEQRRFESPRPLTLEEEYIRYFFTLI